MRDFDEGGLTWRISRYSSTNGDCVEVGWSSPAMLLRDSKDRPGGTLTLSDSGWRALRATASR